MGLDFNIDDQDESTSNYKFISNPFNKTSFESNILSGILHVLLENSLRSELRDKPWNNVIFLVQLENNIIVFGPRQFAVLNQYIPT